MQRGVKILNAHFDVLQGWKQFPEICTVTFKREFIYPRPGVILLAHKNKLRYLLSLTGFEELRCPAQSPAAIASEYAEPVR